ncbi:hypothetical protein [Solibacillus isronensis]|uniref:hypothetical protein n=1 Tax=Solibacillus isronensis TaxID=412383 RepID=UPI0007FB4D55|nr:MULTISPECIES: hypothetical protein [Solibacillus]OBW54811.1 hypothetical protein A9986_14420 [Solibacillus silvestris]
MTPSTAKKPSPKQIEIMKVLLKLRAATIKQLVAYFHPDIHPKSKDFPVKQRSIQKTVKLLKDNGYVISEYSNIQDTFYLQLTQDGQEFMYSHMHITVRDKNIRSGFDFELGYFDWRKRDNKMLENKHSLFQVSCMTALMSLNRLAELDTNEKQNNNWAIGGVRLSNVCSVRDNLHAAPRNTKVKKSHVYKPDGEVQLNQSLYKDFKTLHTVERNGKLSVYSSPERFYLEFDMKTEYGNRLMEKFGRLKRRLDEMAETDELKYYKGMLVILPSDKYPSDLQVQLRHLNFVESFQMTCRSYSDSFEVITCTDETLQDTIVTMRTEYKQDFANVLSTVLKHPDFNGAFTYTTKDNAMFKAYDKRTGDTLARYEKNQNYMYMFFNIEGLCITAWKKAIERFNKTVVQLRDAFQGQKHIVPIVVYRKHYPVFPREIQDTFPMRDGEHFYQEYYVMQISNPAMPVLYKRGEPVPISSLQNF